MSLFGWVILAAVWRMGERGFLEAELAAIWEVLGWRDENRAGVMGGFESYKGRRRDRIQAYYYTNNIDNNSRMR